MSPSTYLAPALCLVLLLPAAARGGDPFPERVIPFLQNYCVKCHEGAKASAELDLTKYRSSVHVGEHFRQWEHVITFLKKEEMPPPKAKQPPAEERAAIIATLEGVLRSEAKKVAGDPGVVLPRRLTNAEYDHTIRDLTGVDIGPTASFPVDPASGEGFTNTGEALSMSPSLFKKYYAAAQHVADHVLLTPSGLRFAPYPAVTFADQKEFHETAITDFYAAHDVKVETYLTAAWSFRHRPAARQRTTIDQWAAEQKLSAKYLRKLWDLLGGQPADESFYLHWLRKEWNALPLPADPASPTPPAELAGKVRTLADQIRKLSALMCPKETQAIVSDAGNGPVQHIARRTKTAGERDKFAGGSGASSRRFSVEFRKLNESPTITIHLAAAGLRPDAKTGYVLLRDLNFSQASENDYRPGNKSQNLSLEAILQEHAPDEWKRLNPGRHPLGHQVNNDHLVLTTGSPLAITVPTKAFGDRKEIRLFCEATLDTDHSPAGLATFAAARHVPTAEELASPTGLLVDPASPAAAQLKTVGDAFCEVFPNRFFYVDDPRGLSAGFHLVEGFFRDDRPLVKHVLSDEENRTLDRLWDELYFGTNISEKELRGFVFFERSERNFLKHKDFDPFKEEDPELVKPDWLNRFEQVYLTRMGVKDGEPTADHPGHLYFDAIRRGMARRREQLTAAKPIYLKQLHDLAERAYRRPLTPAELTKLDDFYESICQNPELGIEQAVRGVVTSLLVSPHYCYRVDPPPAGETVQPLSDLALASRLSYFLWSSMPDAELLAVAKAGKLKGEKVLLEQTRRMLKDDRVSGFAREFLGQWLRYRDFLAEESVDRRVFPAFDDTLKQAMFEEPTRLAAHLIQTNGSLTDLIYGDATFLNKRLADHYGLSFSGDAKSWQRIEGLHAKGRGGIFGMAVFLTANSQPQRTSPVKRGFWVVHKLLGEHIPPPPNEVPPLPPKETESVKTVRELLKLHTEAESCARCHRRFDPVGLAMEGFDPIGRARTKDLAGRAVDNVVKLPSGDEAHGVPEFARHLQATRNDEVVSTLCHKLLGYALGRSVELSDQELLEKMQRELKKDDFRFATLFEVVVTSPQFRTQRSRDFNLARFRAESSGETER